MAMNQKHEQETDLGSLTLATHVTFLDGSTLAEGTEVRIGRTMNSPTGARYYKLFKTPHWVSDEQARNVVLPNIVKRRAVKIYSAT